MHDQSFEPKLRAALRSAGDDLSFTITAEELERRLMLRRRGGLSPAASLGLAAAVGVGLIGLAGVAGGWFDARPVVVPLPSPSAVAVASSSPSPSSEASPGAATLPSLDDLLATIDPARLVRAEAVGPYASLGDQNAENFEPIEPGSVTFDPVATSGAYDVLAVCAGEGRVVLRTVRADPGQPVEEVPITCDGERSIRQVGLAAGDALRLTNTGHDGWRVVLLAPERASPHAAAIDESAVDLGGADVLVDARSITDVPSYADLLTGGGVETRTGVGSVPSRTRYDVYLSCAGPSPIRYAFGGDRSADEVVAPGQSIDYVAGQVECDGTLQHDTINLTLGGADITVTADDRTAWRIVVASEKAPIAIPPNRGGWQLSSGYGPTYVRDGHLEEVSLVGADKNDPVRVVISCASETTLTGTIQISLPTGGHPDSFTIDCSGRSSAATLIRTYDHGNQVDITFDPHGAPVWVAVTTMVRDPASPAP